MRLNKLQQTAVTALEDIKARDIKVLDVRKLTSFYDSLIIASAESNRQVKALAHHVRDKLKEAGATIVGVEGEETGEWVLVDCGDLVVHVMQPAVRAYYNLEELWERASRTGARGRMNRRIRVKLRIVALGHRMPAWVAAGFDEYAKRMPRDLPLDLVELKPEPRDRGRPVAQMLAAEATRIRAACAGATDRGARRARRRVDHPRPRRSASTRWQDEAQDVAFVIGSADGLDPARQAGRRMPPSRCPR